MKTTVVLIRHEAAAPGEKKVMPNTLNVDARQRAFRSGEKLAELGYKIDRAYSSPQFRAVETLQFNLAGNSDGKGPIIPGKLVDGKFVADGAMPMPAESAQEST